MGAYTGADKRLKYLFENGGGGGGGTNVEANPQGTPTAYLNTVKIANAIYSVEKPADIFSLQERQVGVWTNGKPLYQCTILIPSVSTGTLYNHNISNVEEIWVYDVKAKRNSAWFTSGHVFENAYNNIPESFSVIAGETQVYTYVYGNTVTDCYITLQYTKTTDTAGSGIWTPQGSYAHHYSTAEQIIGTWITGKPLYEKTLEIPQSAMTTDGAQRTYAIMNDLPNGVIRHCFGMAISATYGNCTLGSYSYRQNSQGGMWWLFCWYYNLLALRSSNGVNDIINTIKPDITVTVQYTKTTD